MTDAMSAARKARLEAEPYLLEKGWRETAMSGNWADPLTAEVVLFSVAWDRQFERDWAEKEKGSYCVMLRPVDHANFPAKVLGLFSRLDLAEGCASKFMSVCHHGDWIDKSPPDVDWSTSGSVRRSFRNDSEHSCVVITGHKLDR